MSSDEEQQKYVAVCLISLMILTCFGFRFLEDATKVVREQAFYMKRAIVSYRGFFHVSDM